MTLSFATPRTLAVSIVLVSYNMGRELPRTLQSLAPANQFGMDEDSYEVIVVDNGSKESVDVDSLLKINPRLKFFNYPNPTHSPVEALNFGLSLAAGNIVCACIDAARMASPGLLATGLKAARLNPRAVVGSLSYHLGHEPQNISVLKGYNQKSEDKLLNSINWENNGYELFKIASFDPSSRFGFFSSPAESNALFMTREMWAEIGGLDPQFKSRGGGLANLDIWKRLCSNPENYVVLMLGEGTFHQCHGGLTTNSTVDMWPQLNEEYKGIRGEYEASITRFLKLFLLHSAA
jgi:glycosyltransferase involved in cell wall biosynthesis